MSDDIDEEIEDDTAPSATGVSKSNGTSILRNNGVFAATQARKIKEEDEYSDDEPDYSETFGLPVELPSKFRRQGTRASSRSSTGRSLLDTDSGELTARSKDTVVITRLPRTQRLLAKTAIPTSPIRPESGLTTARSMRSSASMSESMGSPTDKSSKPNVWHKDQLNELSYNVAMKRKKEEKRRAQAKLDARAKASAAAAARKPSSVAFQSEGGSGADFLDRLEVLTRRILDARQTAAEQAHFNSRPDKKMCPDCGKEQSFDEYRKNIKKCQRDGCRGAAYRPAKVWDEVAGDFIERLDTFVRGSEKRAESRFKASLPPFRQTTRLEFNPDTGAMEAVPIEKQLWGEVESDFFSRQEAFEVRHQETLAKLEAERQKQIAKEAATMQGIPEMNKYEMKTPLVPFYERQQMFADRKKMSFEEKMADYEAKHGKIL